MVIACYRPPVSRKGGYVCLTTFTRAPQHPLCNHTHMHHSRIVGQNCFSPDVWELKSRGLATGWTELLWRGGCLLPSPVSRKGGYVCLTTFTRAPQHPLCNHATHRYRVWLYFQFGIWLCFVPRHWMDRAPVAWCGCLLPSPVSRKGGYVCLTTFTRAP